MRWKEQVREALGGHKLEVAFDAIGGKAIDDLAEVVDDGGIIINFASLGSSMEQWLPPRKRQRLAKWYFLLCPRTKYLRHLQVFPRGKIRF